MNKSSLKTRFPNYLALALALFIAISLSARAQTYHVDPNTGCDNNSGTKDLPFKTLAKAQQTAQPGDTVILAQGQYGDFTAEPKTRYPSRSKKIDPNAPQWITFQAAEGARPRISHMVFAQEKYTALLAYRLKGLEIVGGGLVLRGIAGFEMENCEIAGAGENLKSAQGGYVSIRLCSSVTLDNCKIHYAPKTCLSISSSANVTINGCEIYDIGEDQITLRTEFEDCYKINITNNIIRSTQQWNPKAHCDAIQFYSDRSHKFYSCRITGNIIKDVSVQGLFIHAGDGRFVDGLIENNLIYNCGSRALILDKTTDTICRNNTIIGTSTFAERNERPAVYNNLFAGPYVAKNLDALDYHNYNIYIRDHKNWLGRSEPNSISYGPGYEKKMTGRLFVNAREGDYRLKPGCRAIDFCPKEPAPDVDITGRPRDEHPDPGCYEFISDSMPTTQNSDFSDTD